MKNNSKLALISEVKEFNCDEKSEEEIKKYLIDENLSELLRVRYILKSGEVLQKAAIYSNLHAYYAWTHPDGIIIFNELISELKKQSSEAQIEAALSLKLLIETSTQTGPKVKKLTEQEKDCIFELTMWMVKQKQVSGIDEWIGVLDAFLTSLDFKKYEKTINEDFFKLSGITSLSLHKTTSMRILGILLKVKKGQISQEMIEMANLFSQTAEVEIKDRVLRDVLESIFHYLPQETLEKKWNEKLLDFLGDNNVGVKCESIEITSRILDKLSENFKTNNIKALFFDLVSSKSPEVKLTFSRFIGPFVLQKMIELKPGNVNSVLSLLQEYCEHPKSEFRVNFLYNLPGILAVFGKRIWNQISKSYYAMLTKDEELEVRVQATHIYLHVLEFVGVAEFRSQIRPHLRSILSSTEEMTAPKAIYAKHLTRIFELYKSDNSKPPRVFFAEILKDLMEILETSLTSPNWRFLFDIITLIARNQLLFDQTEFADLYIPVLFQAILKSTAPVRQCAIDSLLTCITNAPSKSDREAIIVYMSNNFYLARQHHTKRMYLDLTAFLMDKYEGLYVRPGFKFGNILNYHSDKVIAIRKELAKHLVPLYLAVTHPLDKDAYKKLVEAFKVMLQDKDDEVRELTTQAKKDIENDDPGFNEKIKQAKALSGSKEDNKSFSLLPDDGDSDLFPRRAQDNKQAASSRSIGSQQNIIVNNSAVKKQSIGPTAINATSGMGYVVASASSSSNSLTSNGSTSTTSAVQSKISSSGSSSNSASVKPLSVTSSSNSNPASLAKGVAMNPSPQKKPSSMAAGTAGSNVGLFGPGSVQPVKKPDTLKQAASTMPVGGKSSTSSSTGAASSTNSSVGGQKPGGAAAATMGLQKPPVLKQMPGGTTMSGVKKPN